MLLLQLLALWLEPQDSKTDGEGTEPVVAPTEADGTVPVVAPTEAPVETVKEAEVETPNVKENDPSSGTVSRKLRKEDGTDTGGRGSDTRGDDKQSSDAKSTKTTVATPTVDTAGHDKSTDSAGAPVFRGRGPKFLSRRQEARHRSLAQK